MEYGKIGLYEHNTTESRSHCHWGRNRRVGCRTGSQHRRIRCPGARGAQPDRGRIWTSRDLGVPADLGASWIHGFEDNPISRLAKRHGIEILRTDISSVSPARYRSVALYEEDGRRLSGQETVEISEMMADYLDFIALKQTEGREMSLLAVEEEFAATQNFNPGQRRVKLHRPHLSRARMGRSAIGGVPTRI